MVVPASPPAPLTITEKAPPPAEPRNNVTIRRIGVGTLVVGAALAATGAAFAASSWSKFNSSRNGACLTTTECCHKAGDAIEQRNTLSKVFIVAGAAAGITGGALIVFFPVTSPARSASVSGFGASAGWVF